MKYNNYDITKIYYSGYEIASAYGCGGYKVYESFWKFKAKYSDGRTYSAPCNSSTELTTGETRPSGYDYSAMTSAEIGDCVTSISGDFFNSAFKNFTSLTSVTIPDSVTSIGDYAFYNCSSLTSIAIPSGVTSIGSMAFNKCSSLTSVTIPSGVTSISSSAFRDCSGLTNVVIPDSVTIIGSSAFEGCTSLPSIIIPDSVTMINHNAFNACKSLSSITIPDSVTSIGSFAFGGDTGLTSVTIGTGILSLDESPFYNCSGLTSVTINAVNPPTLGRSVFGTSLDTYPIYVPCGSGNAYKTASGWTEYADRIVENCFTGKFKLTYSDDRIYSGECDSSTELTVDELSPSGYNYEQMLSAIVGDCVTSIGRDAFQECTGLTSVTIGTGVTSIHNSAFAACRSLTSVTINAVVPPPVNAYTFRETNANLIIYVPAESLEAYKSSWTDYTSRLQAIA